MSCIYKYKGKTYIEDDIKKLIASKYSITGDMNDKSKDKEIYEEAAKRAVQAIKQGKQVVFDTTNLTKEKRRPFIEAIKKEIPDANIQYKLMPLNPELAKQRIKAQLERGENRANVSDATIDRHAESYKQMLEDIKEEPISNYEVSDSQKQQAIEYYIEKQKGETQYQKVTIPHQEAIEKELTPTQKENISNLKQEDARWQKYSDEDIQRFINQVFPESKVKNIVYRGALKNSEFNYSEIVGKYGTGIYVSNNKNYSDLFTKDLKDKGVTSHLLINVNNIQNYIYSDYFIKDVAEYYNIKHPSKITNEHLKNYSKLLQKENKTIIVGQNIKEYVLFNKAQIYNLNSDKALQDMEEFMNKNIIINNNNISIQDILNLPEKKCD